MQLQRANQPSSSQPTVSRLGTLSPRYQKNEHVELLRMADPERWPELRLPQSSQVSDDESGAPSSKRAHPRYPGVKRLKYTKTIMGPSRVETLGMRVSGRRAMTGINKTPVQRRSISAANATPRRPRGDNEPTPVAAPAPTGIDGAPGSPGIYDGSSIQVSKRRTAAGTSLSEIAPTR